MMGNGTTAVTLDALRTLNMDYGTGQPLCPACHGGRLHPYQVSIRVPGTGPAERVIGQVIQGWVAVCQGNADYLRALAADGEDEGVDPLEPCGFSMPLYPAG
jgi:hypothetical protein